MSDIINSLGGPTPDLPSVDIHRKLKEPHAFSEEERKLVAGIYRRLGELTDALRSVAAKPAATPTQQDLPGIAPHDTADLPDGLVWTNEGYRPGEIAKKIASKPRIWGNVVKVYEVLWSEFGFRSFDLGQMFEFCPIKIAEATKGKVGLASYPRVISTLIRAGAIVKRDGKKLAARQPTDEIREAVERTARKRKEVAA